MKNAKMSFNNSLNSFVMQLMANYQYTFDSHELLSQQPPEGTTKESQWLKITLQETAETAFLYSIVMEMQVD